MNRFFVTAIAEKIFARKAEAYFRERQPRGEPFDVWMEASPDTTPGPGDQI